jgi:hypothetical protein
MQVVNILSSVFLASGFSAWALCRGAARDKDTYDESMNSPASANDASGPDGGAVAARRPIGRLMTALLKGLPALPPRMRTLPRDADGQPIPYLLTQVATKFESSLGADLVLTALCARKQCWLCGQQLGRYAAFVSDPLTSVTKISRTPPAHHDCAKYAAIAGLMQPKDLKVSLVWVTRAYQLQSTANGQIFVLGEAEQTFWFSDGRCATREEVRLAMEEKLPDLYAIAKRGGDAALSGLDLQIARASRQFPPHAALATGT